MDKPRRSALAAALLALAGLIGFDLRAQEPGTANLDDLEMGVRQGNILAMLRLADAYENGAGVDRDARVALTYYCQAARRGSAEGAYRLGRMLLSDAVGPPVPSLGGAWLRTAAALGHRAALRELAALPRDGEKGGAWCPSAPLPLVAEAGGRAAVVERVRAMAPAYGLDPALVLAIIQAESAFRGHVVSPKGAAGLMQLKPDTARRFGVRDVFSVDDNLRGGMTYLAWLLNYFKGDVTRTIAAYNAGEKAVERYNGIPPYPETMAYVETVTRHYRSVIN